MQVLIGGGDRKHESGGGDTRSIKKANPPEKRQISCEKL